MAAPFSSGGAIGTARDAALKSRSHATYEVLIRDVLRRRLLRMYTLQLVATHFILSALLVTSPPGLIAPLRPTVLALTTAAFVVGILPLFVMLKWNLSQPATLPAVKTFLGFSPPFGSRAAYAIEALQSRRTHLNLAAYIVSALLLAIGHAIGLWLYSPETSTAWSPYVVVQVAQRGGTAHEVTRPNERIFVLLALNSTFGLIYAVTRTVLWPRRTLPPFQASPFRIGISQRVSTAAKQRLFPALFLGLGASALEFSTYLFLRRPFFRALLRLIGAQSPLRPLLIPSFATPFLSQSPGLGAQLSSLAAASAVIWELAALLWDVYSSQPANVSAHARDQVRCLVGGLAARQEGAGDPTRIAVQNYYSHFAFAELSHLSASDEGWRRAVWKDIGDVPGGALADGTNNAALIASLPLSRKSAWANIATQCLSVLRAEKELVARRGRPPAPAVASAPGASASQTAQPGSTSLASRHDALVSNQAIVRKPAPTLWDKLFAAGSMSSTPLQSASASESPIPNQPGSSTAVQTSATPNADPGLNQLLHRLAPSARISSSAVAQSSNTTPAHAGAPAVSNSEQNPLTAALGPTARIALATLKWLFNVLPGEQRQLILHYLPVLDECKASSVVILETRAPASPALSAWAAHAATSLLSSSVTEDIYGSVTLAGASHTKAGSEEVVAACAQLLNELDQWQREAEAEAAAADDAANRSPNVIASKSSQDALPGKTLPEAPRVVDHARQRVALAWSQNAGPLQETLRNGLLQVLTTFEAHGVAISPGMRSGLNQALAT